MTVYNQQATRRHIPKDNIFSTNGVTTLKFMCDAQSMTTGATAFEQCVTETVAQFLLRYRKTTLC
jgi:hypothetical protein